MVNDTESNPGKKVYVLDTDTVDEIALKIFLDFTVGQSCTVIGYIEGEDFLELKGDEVLRRMIELDFEYNFMEGRRKRKRRKLNGTIGDYIAHKIWKHKQVTRDGLDAVCIWRWQ